MYMSRLLITFYLERVVNLKALIGRGGTSQPITAHFLVPSCDPGW